MTTGAAISEIIEAYYALGGGWVRIEDVAHRTGMAPAVLAEAIEDLSCDEDFHAEPQLFGHRITAWDRANAPVIGGEAVHLIGWEA